MYAPMLPQLFCIAISSFLISPGSGLVMMLWSFCPVEKKEQNDQSMKMEMPKRISPTVTLVFSLCMKDETPMASLNDTFLELAVSFFFFAIYIFLFLMLGVCEVGGEKQYVSPKPTANLHEKSHIIDEKAREYVKRYGFFSIFF